MNISNLLARHARKYPNQIAVISLGQETTYQQLDEQVNKIAGSLRASRIVKGDKVGKFAIV